MGNFKLSVLFFFCGIVIAVQGAPKWGNFTQRVDNFNPADIRSWQMRYLYNDECFVEGGPIFVYPGDINEIDESSISSGIVYDLACENKGYMYRLEHRYYGKSYPTANFSVENLKYLTIEQALADIANFIEYQKENVAEFKNSSVVTLGDSYSGSLATWSRLKYPHLVDIAYASSAPVLAKVDNPEYYEILSDVIRNVSSTCADIISEAILETQNLLKTEQGVANVTELYKTCPSVNISNSQDVQYFFSIIPIPFVNLVRYANPGDVQEGCSKLENTTGSSIEKFAKYVKDFILYGPDDCIQLYHDYVALSANTSLTSYDSRSYAYQTCTQLGWYDTSISDTKSIFRNTFNADYFSQICIDVIGENFNKSLVSSGVERTNIMYGGNHPDITRLITVQGLADPNYSKGILQQLNPYSVTYLIEGASQSRDFTSLSGNDTQEVRQTKLVIKSNIATWLEEIKAGIYL